MAERFCLIPEGGLNIEPNGNITPCCALSSVDFNLGNITSTSLSSAFNNDKYKKFRQDHRDNNLPEICVKRCITQSNNATHRISRNQQILNAERENFKQPNQSAITTVDIGIGNVCKLTCVFCSPEWSSSWAKLKNETNNIFSFSKEQTMSIVEDLKYATDISFKGGEPLNIPYISEFLNRLHEINPWVKINMISNAVECSDDIVKAFAQFENFHLGISAEATGELYSYLRGGRYNWEEHVLPTVRKFAGLNKNFNITVSSIILLYNHQYWPEQMSALVGQLRDIVGDRKINLCTQICRTPVEQSPYLLRYEARESLASRIRENLNDTLSDMDGVIELLLRDVKFDTTKEKVLDHISYNNNLRGVDLFSIIDDFTDLLDIE
jgi:radical SAM protein with 4Fe4S-binding SPASM domain